MGLFNTYARWQIESFVHGDISPRNILVQIEDGRPIKLYFIDWIIDLDSKVGTPMYAAPEVYEGKHTPDSDRFAIEKVSRIYWPSQNAKRQSSPLGQAKTWIL